MRKLIVWGVALVCAAALLPLSAARAQRLSDRPTARGAENCVTEQALGSLLLQSLSLEDLQGRPLSVNLGGAITVLPPENPRFTGLTSTTFTQGAATRLVLNRACFAEFPGAHACFFDELAASVPPPPEWSGAVLVIEFSFGAASCFDAMGNFTDCGTLAHSAACCSGTAPGD